MLVSFKFERRAPWRWHNLQEPEQSGSI